MFIVVVLVFMGVGLVLVLFPGKVQEFGVRTAFPGFRDYVGSQFSKSMLFVMGLIWLIGSVVVIVYVLATGALSRSS